MPTHPLAECVQKNVGWWTMRACCGRAARGHYAATLAEQRDELASFQLIEEHPLLCQAGPDCRISNWPSSASAYQAFAQSAGC